MSDTNVAKKLKSIDSSIAADLVLPAPELVELHPNALNVVWQKSDIIHKALANGATTLHIRFSAVQDVLPKSRPAKLYQELCQKITHHRHIIETKFTRSNQLIISSSHTDCLLELIRVSSLLNVPVSSTVLTSTITSRFLVRDVDVDTPLIDIGHECIRNGLALSRIVRFTRMLNGKREPSSTLLIEEFGRVSRSYIYLWYMRCRTDVFTERPRQCSHCARFGHISKFCHSVQRCFQCGEAHDAQQCTQVTPKCPLCAESHNAIDRNCRVYKKEAQVLEYATSHHITVPEARRMTIPSASSFAQKLKSSPSTSSLHDALLPQIFDMLSKLLQKIDLLLPDQVSSPQLVRSSVPTPASSLPESQVLVRSPIPVDDQLDAPTILPLSQSPDLQTSVSPALQLPDVPSCSSNSCIPQRMDTALPQPLQFNVTAAERLKSKPRRGGQPTCCFCKARIASMDSLPSHYDSHFIDNSLQCPHCARKFNKSALFIRHLQVHAS